MTSAKFVTVRCTLDMMAERHSSGIRDVFSVPPVCVVFAKAVVDSIEASGGPCPKLLGEDDGVCLTFMLKDCKLFYCICEDEIDAFAFPKAHFGDAMIDVELLEDAR